MAILAYDNNGTAIPATGWPSSENVNFNSESAQSSAFNSSTFLIRVVATADCRVAFGSNPTATSTSARVIANLPEYIKVTPGQKLAVIQDTEAGVLNITSCG